jgi:hypothetical protein
VVTVSDFEIRIFYSCAQALARSAAVCGDRLVEAHPVFGVATEQALQATPCCAHNLLAGAVVVVVVVVVVVHLNIRVSDSCAQALARSADVCCARHSLV